jgi:signal peptidase II
MFEFLQEYLKWIQITILVGIVIYVIKFENRNLLFPTALIVGPGISNIADRFTHGGVVDYFYWHCGFDFAIFNFADVVINLGVTLILYLAFFVNRETK